MELPLAAVGLPANPALRKVAYGEGLKARLKLSPPAVKFGECILRDAQFPYVAEAVVTNADDVPLHWSLDEGAMPAGCGFSLAPSEGTLQPGESETVTIGFEAVRRSSGHTPGTRTRARARAILTCISSCAILTCIPRGRGTHAGGVCR